MSSKDRPPAAAREERLAQALRDNLARRKALQRAKRSRTASDAPTADPETEAAPASPPQGDRSGS